MSGLRLDFLEIRKIVGFGDERTTCRKRRFFFQLVQGALRLGTKLVIREILEEFQLPQTLSKFLNAAVALSLPFATEPLRCAQKVLLLWRDRGQTDNRRRQVRERTKSRQTTATGGD